MTQDLFVSGLEELAPFFAKIGHAVTLTDGDRQALLDACGPVDTVARGRRIVGERDTPDQVYLILGGWAARYVLVPTGSRQILSFLLPGDVASEGLLLTGGMNNIVALATVRFTCFDQHQLEALLRKRPRLADAFHRAKLIDEAMLHACIVSLGRRTAYDKLAHLVCELHARLKIVGQVQDNTIDWPLTQDDLADALGLTAVHTNRTLQALRRDKLVEITNRKRMTLIDPEALRRAAGFDPRYLRAAGTN